MELHDLMKAAASRSVQPLEYRAVAERARKLRRTRIIGATMTVVLLLGVGAVSAGMLNEQSPQLAPAEVPLPPSPTDEIGEGRYIEKGDSFVLTYPAGWRRAEESLTPDLADPVELFSVATLPLEYRETECAHMPMGALELMADTDAFVSVQERTQGEGGNSKDHPPRPADFTRDLEHANLACIPQDLDANFIPFSDQGRLFYALVAFGEKVTPETEAEAWSILNEVTFEPTPTVPTENPAFAEIEGRVAFLSGRGNVVVASGNTYEIVNDGSAAGSRLSWSPDGKKIVHDLGLGPGRGSLVILDVESGETDDLVEDPPSTSPGLMPQLPAWSPDGSKIAFNSGAGDIYVINADGSSLRNIVPAKRGCRGSYPAWSPDGEVLAFTRSGSCGGGVFLVPIGRGEGTLLTDGRDLQPAWSPDGSRIAFSAEGQIVVVQVSTRYETVLTEEPDNYAPSWSPDGSQIVFGSNRTGHQNIWVMNTDGSDELPVTIGRKISTAPAWAPR